jgi:hypothetical protein
VIHAVAAIPHHDSPIRQDSIRAAVASHLAGKGAKNLRRLRTRRAGLCCRPRERRWSGKHGYAANCKNGRDL